MPSVNNYQVKPPCNQEHIYSILNLNWIIVRSSNSIQNVLQQKIKMSLTSGACQSIHTQERTRGLRKSGTWLAVAIANTDASDRQTMRQLKATHLLSLEESKRVQSVTRQRTKFFYLTYYYYYSEWSAMSLGTNWPVLSVHQLRRSILHFLALSWTI